MTAQNDASTKHLSTLTLNRLRYGELTGDALGSARAHLADCADCAARLAAQERNRAAFEAMPVPVAIREATPLPANDHRGWSRWLGAVAAVAAAAVVAITVVSPPLGAGDGDRPKGDVPDVEAWVDQDGGPVKITSDRQVHPGDRIQIRVRGPRERVVTVAGKDGAGRVAVYGTWTSDGDDGWEAAPFALELDDTPGDERFYAIFGDREFDERAVRAAILREQPPAGTDWDVLVLDKEP
jgi:hypothetical protein